MNVTWRCTDCGATNRTAWPAASDSLDCTSCGRRTAPPTDALDGTKVTKCLACGSDDLFMRKDFPQRLGVAIVVVGFVISTIFWAYRMPVGAFAALFAVAAIDFVLFIVMPSTLTCYRCHAQYRDLEDPDAYEAFNLETHERYRQEAARLEKAEN